MLPAINFQYALTYEFRRSEQDEQPQLSKEISTYDHLEANHVLENVMGKQIPFRKITSQEECNYRRKE